MGYGNKVYDTVLYILELEKAVSYHFLYFQKVPQPFQRAPSLKIFKKSVRKFTFFLQSSRLLRVIQVIKCACGNLSCMSQANMKIVSFSSLSSCSGVPLFSSIQVNSSLGEGPLVFFHCFDKYFYHSENLISDKNKTSTVT